MNQNSPSTAEKEQTRFEFVRENSHGNKHEGDDIASALYGYVTGWAGKEHNAVETVYTYTFSPNGVTGKGQPAYEVVLKPTVKEVVPKGIMRVATFAELDVTAIEEREVDENATQRALLLEPADSDKFPRCYGRTDSTEHPDTK
jgi:hypothetical protein